VTFERGSGTAGKLTLSTLDLGNGQNVALISGDTIGGTANIYSGATLTTATTGNISSGAYINIVSGSTLNLGANLNIGSGSINEEGSGSTLNLNGHNLSATTLNLGYYDSSAVNLDRGSGTQGKLNLANLYLGNGQNISLIAGDTITNANVTDGAGLTLTANTNMPGFLNVQDSGSAFYAQGHAVMANELLFGWSGSAQVTVSDLGTVTAADLYVGNGTSLTLHGGDVIGSSIDLQNGSVLTVEQSNGIGLTLNGTSLSSLTIDPSSMDLIFTSTALGNWDFRWKDPSSGNWISTLTTMIDDHQINLTLLPGQTYQVADSSGYTYISEVSVPEPSSLVLGCLSAVGVAAGLAWRRRRPLAHRGVAT
jgi:fibronectin-binding autotransporter adhesin